MSRTGSSRTPSTATPTTARARVRKTVNNDPTIACPNANWNGVTTNYCDGVTSDDVVAHEWGHAYTQFTSGLIYQWQSGALNESYSDMWGETLDLINAREDEGEGDLDAARPVGVVLVALPRRRPLVTINTPPALAKDCLPVGTSARRRSRPSPPTSWSARRVQAGPDDHRWLHGLHQRGGDGGQDRHGRPWHVHVLAKAQIAKAAGVAG